MPLIDFLGSLPGKGQKLQGQEHLRKEEKLHGDFCFPVHYSTPNIFYKHGIQKDPELSCPGYDGYKMTYKPFLGDPLVQGWNNTESMNKNG